MTAERPFVGEKEPVWNSRLFKFGVALAAAGAFFGVSKVAAVGVIAAGGAWALWKGSK